ncbi:MAG: ATP-binding cassette domain-containing protein [Phycisphaerales bacterium]
MVFQQPGLWDHLTVEQHLKLVGATSEMRERVLEQMHLKELRHRRPGAMSGGERQRLSIARALAVEPAWLLLDEPMAHLDGPTRRDLFDLLREALKQSNAGVLLATHHADEALRLADDTAVLIDGRLAQHGPAHDVYHHPASLAAAHATGTASLFNGQITRPEHLAFTPSPEGDAVVERCEFVGPGYLLEVRVQGNTITVWSDQPHDADTAGNVVLRDRVS